MKDHSFNFFQPIKNVKIKKVKIIVSLQSVQKEAVSHSMPTTDLS